MNKRGFTLIEIVMVLVLLGILAAVAVPKYFDLKSKAEEQTAKAVVAECQSRINGKFAEAILQGESCTKSKEKAIEEALTMLSDELTNTKFAYVRDTPNFEVELGLAEISLKQGEDYYGPFMVAIPVCSVTE